MAGSIEFEPPLASITKLIKAVLPSNVQVTKEAREAFQRAAGIFIFYLTHCSNEICMESKRQTIKSEDVLAALRELDLGEFEAPVEEFLRKFNLEQLDKKKRKRDSEEAGSGGGASADVGAGETGDVVEEGVGAAEEEENDDADDDDDAAAEAEAEEENNDDDDLVAEADLEDDDVVDDVVDGGTSPDAADEPSPKARKVGGQGEE